MNTFYKIEADFEVVGTTQIRKRVAITLLNYHDGFVPGASLGGAVRAAETFWRANSDGGYWGQQIGPSKTTEYSMLQGMAWDCSTQ